MSEEYNQAIANHYSAYRPPLHAVILKRALSNNQTFQTGLDVGSGTGCSTIALAEYCQQVYGVEPSSSMRSQAAPLHNVTYFEGNGDALPLPDRSIDIVTFAGSLFYAKSEKLAIELHRVCRKHAIILCYDFEVLLDSALKQCDIHQEGITSDYDHEINLSGFDNFVEILIDKQSINFNVSAEEFVHILLSDSYRYNEFVRKLRAKDPFLPLVKQFKNKNNQLNAMMYFSKYQIRREN